MQQTDSTHTAGKGLSHKFRFRKCEAHNASAFGYSHLTEKNELQYSSYQGIGAVALHFEASAFTCDPSALSILDVFSKVMKLGTFLD